MGRLELYFAALFVCGAVLAMGQSPGKAVIGYIYSPDVRWSPGTWRRRNSPTSAMPSPISKTA